MTKGDQQNVYPPPNNRTIYSTTPQNEVADTESDNQFISPNLKVTVTDTVVAVTVAVLACVILITLVFIIKAIKKRRRLQQGDQLNQVPTVSTGIMGTGVAAYSNTNHTNNHNNGVEANISWEPIDPIPSSSNSLQLPHRGDNSV